MPRRPLLLGLACLLLVAGGSEAEQAPPRRTAAGQAGPGATPTPDLRPVHEYVAALRPLFADYSGATSSFARLYGRAAADPAVLADGGWNEELALAVTRIRAYGGEMQALEVPGCMAAFHARLLDAIGYYDEAMQIFAGSIADLDGETRNRGTRLLGDG